MSLSSFCVVTNALRLNLFDLWNEKRDRPRRDSQAAYVTHITRERVDDKQHKKEDSTDMEITVNGMMCAHCEAHVKEALEKIEGVTEAVADHGKNLVTLSTAGAVSEEAIKAAVETAGYEYAGIK